MYNELIDALRCYGKIVPMECPNMVCKYNVLGTCERERMARDAADAIEKMTAQVPAWISVEERLPENDDEVIVAYKCNYEPGFRVSTDCYNPRAGRWDLDRKYTHWMPLPQPPEGKQ